MKIIKYIDPTKKIPRGRLKTNHQVKISTSTNLQEQPKTSILQKKYQQTFNDQTPHQLAKQCQHNSEELIKMSKE